MAKKYKYWVVCYVGEVDGPHGKEKDSGVVDDGVYTTKKAAMLEREYWGKGFPDNIYQVVPMELTRAEARDLRDASGQSYLAMATGEPDDIW